MLSFRADDSIEPRSGDKAMDRMTIAIVVGVVLAALIAVILMKKSGSGA